MTTLQKLEELIYKGFKETDERLALQRQETEALIAKEQQKTEKQWRETDRRFTRLHQELGGVTDSLSRFSEQTVVAATKRLFGKRGIALERLSVNFEEHINGEQMETDVIGVGPDCAVLLEVKLRLRQEDVEDFLDRKLPRFFEFFPYFRRPILYGGVAGLSIDHGVDRFAYKRGLFVISQTGDNLKILNDKKFQPRSFAEKEDNRFAKRKAN